MEKYSVQKRVLALSAEAKRRPTIDMWRVRSDQATLPRIGKTMLGCVLRSEKARNIALARVARSAGGTSILGHGAEQIVMADGNDVVKLLFGTIKRDEAHVIAAAKKLQADADTCQAYLQDHWLPTTFEPVALAGGERFAVVARQERLMHPHFFHSTSQVRDGSELRVFARNILTLHEETGLFPDIIGPENIALRTGDSGICQIDTIPVTEEVLAGVANGESHTNREILRQKATGWLEA